MVNYKTMQILVKKGHRMHSYFQEMCQNAKNMYNTTNFYIRQVHTGLIQEKDLQPLQKEVLDTIQKHLTKNQRESTISLPKKVTREKTKPIDKRKEIKCNLFEGPSEEKSYVNYNFWMIFLNQ